MISRRAAWIALVSLITAVGLSPATASAADGHFQAVPVTEWTQPGTAPLDGIGQWVYVEPIPPAQPGQVATTGYVYGPTFLPSGAVGVVGLSTDPQGPVAGIQVHGNGSQPDPAPATIRYAWSPGRLYFLLAYHLGNGLWGGWVYDYSAGAVTFIGVVQAPAGTGLPGPTSANLVDGAIGQPRPPFWRGARDPVATCAAFPRVDVWFSSPVGYRATGVTMGTVTANHPNIGDCPTVSTVEGWLIHQRFGTGTAG